MLNLIPELFFILHNLHIFTFYDQKSKETTNLKQGSETKYLILDIAICSHLNTQLPQSL